MNLRKQNILIVDDNYEMLTFMQRVIKILNYNTYKASSVSEAIDVLKHNTIDLLITDIQMPETDGIELVKFTEEHFPKVSKLVITGVPSIDNALNSLKSGALEYLIKPFTSDEFSKAIAGLLLKTKNIAVRDSLKATDEYNFGEIIGHSQSFKDLIDIIKRVKDNKATILIEGESGTGKELIAKAIHYKGSFSKMPFISVNCGGIPENLMESELFGFVKGAFTGAAESKIGYFQAASGGTIFLDEIGNAPISVQTRLLRVLQEKEITRIGSTTPEKIDVRIICATNSNIRDMIAKGTFREDLYYRINVIKIDTTPLRERKEDIVLLTQSFLKKYGAEYNKPQITIDEKVLEILMRYSWPGNIRELENIIQRMIILSNGDNISLQEVPEYLKYNISKREESFKSLKEYEKELILKVLLAVNNNKTKAAKILQIDRKTLNQKIG